MSERYFKWLTEDQNAPLGSGKWVKNRWRSVDGALVPCSNGLHFARSKELVEHISDRLWIAEIDPSEIVDAGDKIVVRRARVIERVETITEWSLRAFAADCAERVVDLTGPDPRCVEAIRVARLFALQKASKEELAAARDPAWAAARDPAWAAAMAAARAAARDPARAAAMAAAMAAARDPAWAAAWAAAMAAANARLLQYVEHGMAAMEMPWPEKPAWPVAKAKSKAA